MRRLAVIPARGGSKRLPRKNVLPFLGKPMLIWTCEAARDSGIFDEVLVSTEDAEIASVAREYGFAVDERPQDLGGDSVSVADVCMELLKRKEMLGEKFDILCVLYATAPMRSSADIVNVISLLDDDSVDFAHAMTSYAQPPHQMMFLDREGYYSYAWPLVAYKKSQEVPVPVVGNGSTYAARTSAFMRTGKLAGARLKGYLMPRFRSVDIDTQEDLDFALMCAAYLEGNK